MRLVHTLVALLIAYVHRDTLAKLRGVRLGFRQLSYWQIHISRYVEVKLVSKVWLRG